MNSKKVLGKSLNEIIKENKIEDIKGLNLKTDKPNHNNNENKEVK